MTHSANSQLSDAVARDLLGASDLQLTPADVAQLNDRVNTALLSGDPFLGGTRRAMAATLRWAADRPETQPDAYLRLHAWADQLDNWAASASRHEHEPAGV